MPKKVEDMSVRDWYAGMALQGLTSEIDLELVTARSITLNHEKIAKFCYDAADAILKEREARDAE
jgi:hypothetical protein